MTFAEYIAFGLLGFLLYVSMRPLQRRLEQFLLKWYRRINNIKDTGETIDITDYKKQTKSTDNSTQNTTKDEK